MSPPQAVPVLEVDGLTKHFVLGRGPLRRGRAVLRAVDGVSFAIPRGRTLGVVGESGCGKTTTAKLILHLERPTAGVIRFEGEALDGLDARSTRAFRRAVQAVFQDPFASLNPRMRVGAIVAEPLITHEKLDAAEVHRRVEALLDLVGLPGHSAGLFPHEFSGGQRQRIAIARALSVGPRLVVLDEPVSALDVSIRAQILNLLTDLQDRLGVSYLFITHDLAAVGHMSHEIAVMYLGRVVEIGDALEVSLGPRHPYTQALFAAALPEHPDRAEDAVAVAGEVPSPLAPPAGCHFHPRCPHALPRCAAEAPQLRTVGPVRVACHLYDAEAIDARPAA